MPSRSDSRPRHFARGAAAACLAVLLAGCGDNEAPPCTPGMPTVAQLRAQPEFASLKFHRRVEYDVRRGVGYDLWGDQRFEYRRALELELVPAKGARTDNDLCVQAISIRTAEPGDATETAAMVTALARAVAPHTTLEASRIASQLIDLEHSGAKYKLLQRQGDFTVSAGRVAHPSRDEFFVVSFAWGAR